MTTKFMGLCVGRHDIPDATDGFVFPNTVANPFDFVTLTDTANKSIGDCDNLILFVTGLTPVLIVVVNLCHQRGIKLTLMHFNTATNSYVSQNVDWLFHYHTITPVNLLYRGYNTFKGDILWTIQIAYTKALQTI